MTSNSTVTLSLNHFTKKERFIWLQLTKRTRLRLTVNWISACAGNCSRQIEWESTWHAQSSENVRWTYYCNSNSNKTPTLPWSIPRGSKCQVFFLSVFFLELWQSLHAFLASTPPSPPPPNPNTNTNKRHLLFMNNVTFSWGIVMWLFTFVNKPEGNS